MENLNAEQIKKALECCKTTTPEDCIECPYRNKGNSLYTGCVNTLVKDALALITSQEQRIGELTEAFAVKVATLIEFDKNIERLTEENERLGRICESYALQYGTARDKEVFLKKERADTVKELSKKLINHFDECGAFTDMETDFIALEIDNVAEEFLRGR